MTLSKTTLYSLAILLFPIFAFTQIFESEVNPDGIVFPRMTTVDRDALTAIQGQCIYNIDSNSIECFNGSDWQANIQSNSITTPKFGNSGGLTYQAGYNTNIGRGEATRFSNDTIMIASSYWDTLSGQVRITAYAGKNWITPVGAIYGENYNDNFGRSIASTNDGKHVVITAPGYNDNTGAIYFGYGNNITDLANYQKVISPSNNIGSSFGADVDIDENYAIVGSAGENKAYIFYYNGASWVLNWTLVPPNGLPSSQFGFSVAIDGTRAIVTDNIDSKVHLYELASGSWSFKQTISAPNDCLNEPLCFFGKNADISNSSLVIHSLVEVYTYEATNSGTFVPFETIGLAPFGVTVRYGKSFVSINGSTLGARLNDGKIHFYCKVNGTWNHVGYGIDNAQFVEIRKDESSILTSGQFDRDNDFGNGYRVYNSN